MVQIPNADYAAIVGERDALSVKNVDLAALVVSLTDMLEAALPTLKSAGWQIHNEEAVIKRAKAALGHTD